MIYMQSYDRAVTQITCVGQMPDPTCAVSFLEVIPDEGLGLQISLQAAPGSLPRNSPSWPSNIVSKVRILSKQTACYVHVRVSGSSTYSSINYGRLVVFSNM